MTPPVAAAGVRACDTSLSVEWDDGTRAVFPGIWLRDNLPEDRDRHSGQRQIDVEPWEQPEIEVEDTNSNMEGF